MSKGKGGNVSSAVWQIAAPIAAQLGVAGLAGTFQNWQDEILPFLREASDELAALL